MRTLFDRYAQLYMEWAALAMDTEKVVAYQKLMACTQEVDGACALAGRLLDDAEASERAQAMAYAVGL